MCNSHRLSWHRYIHLQTYTFTNIYIYKQASCVSSFVLIYAERPEVLAWAQSYHVSLTSIFMQVLLISQSCTTYVIWQEERRYYNEWCFIGDSTCFKRDDVILHGVYLLLWGPLRVLKLNDEWSQSYKRMRNGVSVKIQTFIFFILGVITPIT